MSFVAPPPGRSQVVAFHPDVPPSVTMAFYPPSRPQPMTRPPPSHVTIGPSLQHGPVHTRGIAKGDSLLYAVPTDFHRPKTTLPALFTRRMSFAAQPSVRLISPRRSSLGHRGILSASIPAAHSQPPIARHPQPLNPLLTATRPQPNPAASSLSPAGTTPVDPRPFDTTAATLGKPPPASDALPAALRLSSE